ncbi:hypothetical protein NDS46_09850 [Paenibacillus thiaminolyticus]|uniref:hypothetical protein n=1 Tax=Paenibacillus thiaminolyticus TaxID=49283 RepID=UPI0023304DBA|nr:hypothetical protein [Paenibacillus thiaminolyticus]WCF10123.1 hypothetical protein NDS46_09850 [Paenibacillus thiaminolyticus]
MKTAGHYLSWNMTLQFALSALAILSVSGFLGRSTEAVSHYAGTGMKACCWPSIIIQGVSFYLV